MAGCGEMPPVGCDFNRLESAWAPSWRRLRKPVREPRARGRLWQGGRIAPTVAVLRGNSDEGAGSLDNPLAD
jgi:hypothetical protein